MNSTCKELLIAIIPVIFFGAFPAVSFEYLTSSFIDKQLELGPDANPLWPQLKLLVNAECGVYKFRFFLHGETSVIGQTGITRPLVSIFVKLISPKKRDGKGDAPRRKFPNSPVTLRS